MFINNNNSKLQNHAKEKNAVFIYFYFLFVFLKQSVCCNIFVERT